MMNRRYDYKDRIQQRAETMAYDEYDMDFYDLPQQIRDSIYERAMKDPEVFIPGL